MSRFIIIILAVLLGACTESPAPTETVSKAAESPAVQPAAPAVQDNSEILATALAAQPEDVQARYTYRHPQETLEFFGIEPGMTVYETPRAVAGTAKYCSLILDRKVT